LLSAAGVFGEESRVLVRFLLGPAGSGKTFRCLADIRAALKTNPDGPLAAPEQREGGPLILLAPKQATFQLERQLLVGGEISGYTRLHIFSFDRLARFVLEKLGVAPPKLLSDEGRIMVLRALLMRHGGEIELFGRSARRPGFAQELSALLAELQQHQFTPAKLRALGEPKDLRRELRGKLHDLALLHENYTRWLAEHELQDANCLLDFATDKLRATIHDSRFTVHHLWLDGFAEMTPQELDLLAAILPFCERATLAFCLDESSVNENGNSWLSIWNAVGKTHSRCRQRIENLPGAKIETEFLPRQPEQSRFPENCALAALEEGWARPLRASERRAPARLEPELAEPVLGAPTNPAIRITACAHPEAEAVFAAREILKFVRAGNRFRDCAVIVRNLDNYHKPLARVFHRYEIPFFLDRRESVAHHPLAELTRGALRTVAFDWRHDDWFATLKAGFCPVEETAIDRLENAALEFGWCGKKWREPLPDENLERLRRNILPPFENFSAQLGRNKFQPTGRQLADALRELWDDLDVEQALERWTLDDGKSAIRNPQSAIHQTVLEQMSAWLDNLALAFPRENMTLRDWLQILEAGLAGLAVGVIPPVLDEVLIGAIDRARNPDLKLALVLGVNESVFPATPASSTILTDADRDELGQTVSLGLDLRERLSRERFFGYIACTRASEKLVLTFSRNAADGKTLNPSPFVAHLRIIFPALEIEEFQSEIKPADAEHVNELVSLLAKSWERRAPARRVGVHALACSEDKLKLELQPKLAGTAPGAPPGLELLEIPAFKLLAGKVAELREPDPAEKLSTALAENLYGNTLQTSVSRLEEFAQCPFKFFVRSGLHAGERKLFEMDARERGSFQHEVLKNFHEQLQAEGKRWRDLTSTEARKRVAKIAAELVDNFHDGLIRDTARTRFEAAAMAESLQDFIEVIVTWMRGQYEFDPAAAELDFGGKDSSATAWEIDLDGGHRLALRGRIDRIDLCRDGDRTLAVVMDYKSGGKKLDAVLLEHGVQLQLLAYLNVLRHWKTPLETFGVEKLVAAGAFYVNLRGQFESGKTRDEVLDAADERQIAYRHNGRFDADALPKLDSAGAKDQFSHHQKLPRAEFEALLDSVEARLKEMGQAIFSGAAEVDPYRKGAETPCQFCDYRAVCRIDPWTHRYRVLRAAPKENPE